MKKLLNVLNETDAGTNDKECEFRAYLVQCLDSRSILMLTNDCKGDGPKATTSGPLQQHRNTEVGEPIGEVHNTTESMVDYLTRAEYASKQLELAGEKVSENMVTSIVFKGLPSECGYFKTVHEFLKDKASFAEVKKALKNSKILVTYKVRQLAVKMLLCYPKELLRKIPRVNLNSSPRSVGIAVKVHINKPLEEYPAATFAGVLRLHSLVKNAR